MNYEVADFNTDVIEKSQNRLENLQISKPTFFSAGTEI